MEIRPFLFLLFFLLRIPHLHHAEATSELHGSGFSFHGLQSTNTSLDGLATIAPDGLLCITNTTARKTGHAFHSTPFRFRTPQPLHRALSFSTTFVFAIVPDFPGIGTHGMAFVISPDKHLYGEPRRYLGIFNSTNNGNASNHIVAVEFDLKMTPDLKDINDNHVGIDVNGLESIASSVAGYYANDGPDDVLTNLTLVSGDPMQVWVDYDDTSTRLDVTLSPLNVPRPKHPTLSAKIDLADVLLDTMYVGFSGSTGKVPLSQYVLGWSFQVNGRAQPLDLSILPKLPRRSGEQGPPLLTILMPFVAVATLLLIIGCAIFVVKRKMKYAELLEDWEVEYGPHRFSYKDLFKATKGFRDKELLGRGGFGGVYRGVLPSSKAEVAVKKVSHDSRQGMREFVAEIVSIGRLRHRNLVQLLGYCRRKGELLLVYDYMPNGSLDKYLFDNKGLALDWSRRFQIIKGVASGLLYLHEEWEQVVVHRDVKASNVLLDADLNAKLGDFGLARLCDHGTDPRTTNIVGTMGYIAPELTRRGKAAKSTDVFAFGVFLLEVACGRRPIEPNAPSDEVMLVDWVMMKWAKGWELVSSADNRLRGEYAAEEVELVLKLGLLCCHSLPDARPSMRQVMQYLEGALPLPEMPLEWWKESAVPAISGGGGDSKYEVSSASSCAVVNVSDESFFLSGGR